MFANGTQDLDALRRQAMADLEAASSNALREPAPPKRDWKKVVLILGLGALSWVATYIGMLELIQANMGSLTLSTKLVIACSVAMLMTMIIWLLDQLFAPLPFATKAAYLVGYLFLTAISVGFGFGFYWKVLESRSEATRSASSAVTQIQGSLVTAASRLDQLTQTLTGLTALSSQKAIEERDFGTSCPNSRPGDGPRRKLRDDDAAKFGFASSFVEGRAGAVKADLSALDGALKKIATNDPSTFGTDGTRNAFMKNLERRLEMTATKFNAFRSDPQLRQIRADLADRSTTTLFPTGRGNGTFSCPDPQLQTALRGVVTAIDQLPELAKPNIATVEGSQAVIEAFRRLSASGFGVLAFNPPPAADQMRELQKRAVRQAETNGGVAPVATGMQGGLTQRDYIPLAIALFVDLCLLLVSIGRPMNRMENLVPRMRAAEQGPIYQILSRFSDIHRDPEIREKFEIFRHVVFDFNGDYYVAVPLNAPGKRNPQEAQELLQQAHLLANLFSSFEKEKIFTRVINPLLSNGAIRRKLRRQGSSFADAEAFRVYRFRDGAWSEIILGAVMGAARRAEAERRLRALTEGPKLPEAAAVPLASQPASITPAVEAQSHAEAQTAAGIEADAVVQELRLAAGASLVQDSAPRAIDATAVAGLQNAFGPYASQAARDFQTADIRTPDPSSLAGAAHEEAGSRHVDRPDRGTREPVGFRLRRLKPRVPEEAEVAIQTGPTRTLPDNVIRLRRKPDAETPAIAAPTDTLVEATVEAPTEVQPSASEITQAPSAASHAPTVGPVEPPTRAPEKSTEVKISDAILPITLTTRSEKPAATDVESADAEPVSPSATADQIDVPEETAPMVEATSSTKRPVTPPPLPKVAEKTAAAEPLPVSAPAEEKNVPAVVPSRSMVMLNAPDTDDIELTRLSRRFAPTRDADETES
jgi:hypothetical protein